MKKEEIIEQKQKVEKPKKEEVKKKKMEYDKDRYMKKGGDNRTETKSRKGKDFERRQKQGSRND